MLQTEFHASRATIYRAFDAVGGVARFVREQRLAAVYRDLQTAPPTRGAIRRVAQSYGFYDQTSFLRMFRARFGARPSDVLGTALQDDEIRVAALAQTHTHLPSLARFWSA